MRAILTGIVARPTVQPSVDVSGPVQGRRVVVEGTAPRARRDPEPGADRPRYQPRRRRPERRAREGRTTVTCSDPEVALTTRPVRSTRAASPAGGGRQRRARAPGRPVAPQTRAVHQYNSFLANPDPSGPSKRSYRSVNVVPLLPAVGSIGKRRDLHARDPARRRRRAGVGRPGRALGHTPDSRYSAASAMSLCCFRARAAPSESASFGSKPSSFRTRWRCAVPEDLEVADAALDKRHGERLRAQARLVMVASRARLRRSSLAAARSSAAPSGDRRGPPATR